MSFLAIETERLEAARAHYRQCELCEHRCGVNRLAGERGPCHAAAEARVFRHRVEYGEELELIPSHLFYLSGCDLRCAFCIAGANAFDPQRGDLLTTELLRSALAWGRTQGARNLQWVGGEPTIHIPAILQSMAGAGPLPPIVWKSDFYGTPEALALLDGVVDVYVADLKFGNDQCARRIAGVERYLDVVLRNLLAIAGRADLIVRHLLLPGHHDCCYLPIVELLERHLPEVKFSIRDGYMPRWRSKHFEELASPLERAAGGAARRLATERGLTVIA